MLRKLLGTGLLLATLAGCTKLEGSPCTSDADCESAGGLCDTSAGVCYAAGTDVCTPACAEYEGCTKDGCKRGFARVLFRTPANNVQIRGGTIEVSARLEVEPTFADVVQYPDSLIFAATRDDGGDVGSFGTVTRNGDVYTVQWTAPSGQAQLTLTATHPVAAANVPGGTLTVRVDTEPPAFAIIFPNAPARLPGGTDQADEKDPDPGYATAFRRDESVTVMVSANEPATNVTLKVMGIVAGGGEGAAMAPVAVQPGGTCGGSPPFCGTATVNLSLPEMREFRGTMQFLVEGTDAAGNPGSVKQGLTVTRWKWAFEGAGAIKASPAVGEKGVVYFGTAVASGKVFAIEPSGKKKWEVPVESVEGSPTVGAFSNDTEFVYVASNFSGVGIPVPSSGTRLRAINGADGTVLPNPCTFSVTSGPAVPAIFSAAALTATTISSASVETALFVASGYGSAVGLRPTGAGATSVECVNSDVSRGMPDSTLGGGLVATNNGQFAYPSENKRIVKYTFGNVSALWSVTPGGGSGQRVFGLALLGNNLLGSGGIDADQGGVFQVAFDSPGSSIDAMAGTVDGRVYQLAATADNQAYFGRESTNPAALTWYTLSPPGVAQTVPGTGVLVAAPVLGVDEKLYTLNKTGDLAVWAASDLTSLWKFSISSTNVEASPTLDCARNPDGTPAGQNLPGVLYVAIGSKMHAFVVDSPRMLTDANSWPKYQHDARNTGNPATPITNCP